MLSFRNDAVRGPWRVSEYRCRIQKQLSFVWDLFMWVAVLFLGSSSSRAWRFVASRFEGASFLNSCPGSVEREAPASADAEDARVS